MKKLFILMVAVLSSLSARSELPSNPTISNDVTQNGLFVDYCSAPEIDTLSCWMSLLPSTTPLFSLTIPGLHDAATWSYEEGSTTEICIKDQVFCYGDAWRLGARAFDLRIAYEASTSSDFNDAIRFHHGDSEVLALLGIGPMNRVDEDVEAFFPTLADLGDECMILIVKKEYLFAEHMEGIIFSYLGSCLEKKYGKDRFIAYHDGMTLGEARGKIILFARTEEFTTAMPTDEDIPINYLTDMKVSPYDIVNIEVYQNKEMLNSYETRTQDYYALGGCETSDMEEKLGAVQRLAKIDNPFGKAFFNGLNAYCEDDYLFPLPFDVPSDWTICSYINPAVAQDLEQGIYPYYGIQLCDFYGVDTYQGYNFSGLRLAKAMVRSNFK